MELETSTLRRLIIVMVAAMSIFGLVVFVIGQLTKANVQSMEKIADEVSELSVSDNGNYVFVSEQKLIFTANKQEKITLVDGFSGSDVAISPDAKHLAIKTEKGCEIRTLPEFKTVRTESCLTQLWWVDNEQYFYFRGDNFTDSDFFDETTSTLVLASINSALNVEDPSVSPNSTLIVQRHGEEVYVAVSSFLFDDYVLCKMGTGERIFESCSEGNGEVESLASLDDLYGAVVTDGQITIIRLVQNNDAVETSVSFKKAFTYNDEILMFDEFDPEKTVIRELFTGKSKLSEYEGLRAHGIQETHTIEDGSSLLVLSLDGLWGVNL